MPTDAQWRCGEFEWELRKQVPYTYTAGDRSYESTRSVRDRVVDETDAEAMEDPNVKCSMCGSLTPQAMMKRMRAGEEIIPTDKAYKIYVGPDHAKFYMNHMTSAELSREFWDAYTSKRMKVAEPGHFYARIWLPAFPKPADLTVTPP